MLLTKDQIRNLKEDELRTRVLIPLFKAMGYQDVFHYHGGALEQGKDIVMWKAGDLGERECYGVVVKVGDVSGKAAGSSNVSEVRTQIEQCCGKNYLDPVSNKECTVDECWVVCSGEIKKEANNALSGILKENKLDRITKFIDGNKIWELIEKYLPKKAILENLQKTREVLEQIDPNYRFVAKTGKDGIEFSIEPKHDKSLDECPINISTQFVFPDTAEGKDLREKLDRHFKTGSPITIPKEYINDVRLPDFLTSFFGLDKVQIEEVKMSSSLISKPLLVKAEIICADGSKRSIDYIHLEKIQAGTEEVTLDNSKQPIPFKFKIILNIKSRLLNFSYSLVSTDANPKQELEGLYFMEAMSKGGMFKIEHYRYRH